MERAGTAETGSRYDLARTEMPNPQSNARGAAGVPALHSPCGTNTQLVHENRASPAHQASPRVLHRTPSLCENKIVHSWEYGPFLETDVALNCHREEEEMEHAERFYNHCLWRYFSKLSWMSS